MTRLRVYTVHINPSVPNPYEDAKFIEEGLNWKAFFFSGLWTLYKGLWLPSALIIGVNAAVIMLGILGASSGGVACIFLAWDLIIGYLANDWLQAKLKRQGYIVADIVTGDSLLRAEQRFFDRYFSTKEPAAAFSS